MKSEIEKFDYEFPEEAIAQEPASPRDSAQLLVYDRKSRRTTWTTFAHLPEHLPAGAVLVLNETKVIPARLTLRKLTGGRVKILFLKKSGGTIRVLADRLLKPGDVVVHESGRKFSVLERSGSEYSLRADFPSRELNRLLEKHGETPIPPYIKRSPLGKKDLAREYQTVFAKKRGSVAAPTASLHFTPELLRRIEKNGTKICRLVLHVNLGTFAPLREEHLRTGRLHKEEFEVSAETARAVNAALKKGKPVIAVGTTVVRALESAGRSGKLKAGRGETDLFIRESHRPRIASSLITNFHVPKSSLLMLVSAFLARPVLLRLYREAIGRKFRLFSFGDAMFIR